MLDTTWAAWTLLKRDANIHFFVQSLSSRPFHFDGARCARAFFFLKRMIKKIACSAQGDFEFLHVFDLCLFLLLAVSAGLTR